jgi:hypothetical protein
MSTYEEVEQQLADARAKLEAAKHANNFPDIWKWGSEVNRLLTLLKTLDTLVPMFGYDIVGTNGGILAEGRSIPTAEEAKTDGIDWTVTNGYCTIENGNWRMMANASILTVRVSSYMLHRGGAISGGQIVGEYKPAAGPDQPHGYPEPPEEPGEPVGRNQWLGLVVIAIIIIAILWFLPKAYGGSKAVPEAIKEAV